MEKKSNSSIKRCTTVCKQHFYCNWNWEKVNYRSRPTYSESESPLKEDCDSGPKSGLRGLRLRLHTTDQSNSASCYVLYSSQICYDKIITFSLTVSCPVGCVPACTVQKFRLSVCPQGVVIKSTVTSGVQKHPMCAPTVSITMMMIWWLRKAAWVNAFVMMLFGLQNLRLWKKLEISWN